MCDRCRLIDYPIADCWRPCYVPPSKPRGFIPATPAGGFSDEDYSAQTKINTLLAIIRKQREEISTLKVLRVPRDDSRESFEGVA